MWGGMDGDMLGRLESRMRTVELQRSELVGGLGRGAVEELNEGNVIEK